MTIRTTYLSNWQLPFKSPFTATEQLEFYAEQVRANTQGYSRYSQINETPPEFQSTKDSRPFDCPIYLLDPSKVIVFADNLNNSRMKDFISEKSIQFPIHPANELAPRIDEVVSSGVHAKLPVFPTASTRTVRIWDDSRREGFKLDLHRRISRFDRRLGPGTISHSVEVSKRLAEYLDQSSDPHTAILKEDFGAAFITEKGPQVKGWGYLHRDMNLYPALEPRSYTIPLFSIYGNDPATNIDPVLAQILDGYETNKERIEAVLENVYFPIIRSWTQVFQNTGIVLEPHGQNSKIEFIREDEENYQLTGRIGHLDFDAAVSKKMLDTLQIGTQGLYKGQLIINDDGHEISTIYDKSVGKMLFDQIASLMNAHYKIDPANLQQRCQSEFARCFPNFDEYLPEKTYKYSDDPIADNYFGYVCTGENPTWRPSKGTSQPLN